MEYYDFIGNDTPIPSTDEDVEINSCGNGVTVQHAPSIKLWQGGRGINLTASIHANIEGEVGDKLTVRVLNGSINIKSCGSQCIAEAYEDIRIGRALSSLRATSGIGTIEIRECSASADLQTAGDIAVTNAKEKLRINWRSQEGQGPFPAAHAYIAAAGDDCRAYANELTIIKSIGMDSRLYAHEKMQTLRGCTLGPRTEIKAPKVELGKESVIGQECSITADTITIGEGTTLSEATVIRAKEVIIGDNTKLMPGTQIIADRIIIQGNPDIGARVVLDCNHMQWHDMVRGEVLKGLLKAANDASTDGIIQDGLNLIRNGHLHWINQPHSGQPLQHEVDVAVPNDPREIAKALRAIADTGLGELHVTQEKTDAQVLADARRLNILPQQMQQGEAPCILHFTGTLADVAVAVHRRQ